MYSWFLGQEFWKCEDHYKIAIELFVFHKTLKLLLQRNSENLLRMFLNRAEVNAELSTIKRQVWIDYEIFVNSWYDVNKLCKID